MSYTAQEDNRSVRLSRGVGDKERFVLEDGNWVTYGDSIYSAKGRPDANSDKRVPLSIQAGYGGNWTTKTPTWTAGGFAPAEGAVSYQQDANGARGITAFGTPEVELHLLSPTLSYHTYYPSEPTGAQDYDTTLTVTDTDGANATARYHLTLHDPVEMLDEGENITTYSLRSPMRLGGQIMAWKGERAANTAETPVKVVTSTETGLNFTATASVDALKGLLGFSAEASATSTLSLSVSTETNVPAIPASRMVYLIAIHNFQRKHVRFLQFDEAGKVPRMVTRNSFGTVFNPPVEMYHEAFRDTAFMPNYEWSSELDEGTDLESLPHDQVPPLEYDFYGAGQ